MFREGRNTKTLMTFFFLWSTLWRFGILYEYLVGSGRTRGTKVVDRSGTHTGK